MARAPFAVWRPIPSSSDPSIEPIGVILHVDAGNAYSLYNWFSGPSKGIESHFHIAKDGHIEQYRDTNQEADANYLGNSFMRNGKRVGFISVETQGYGNGEWTPHQLRGIKKILTWADQVHPLVQLRKCPGPFEPGVGYHVQFGAPGPWTPSAKTCPGPDRIRQFTNVIVPWMEEDMQKVPMPDFVKKDIDYLKARGYFPAGVPSEEYYDMWRVYAYLARADRSLFNRAVEWARDHVKTSIAAALATGAGAGQIDYPELIRRIGEILAGG